MDLRATGFEGIDLTPLIEVRVTRRVILSMAMRLQVPYEPGYFLKHSSDYQLLPSYLSAYEDGTDRVSETSAYKIQTAGNYPEESMQHP